MALTQTIYSLSFYIVDTMLYGTTLCTCVAGGEDRPVERIDDVRGVRFAHNDRSSGAGTTDGGNRGVVNADGNTFEDDLINLPWKG